MNNREKWMYNILSMKRFYCRLVVLLVMVSLRYGDCFTCPAGYKLVTNILPVNSGDLTWSEAAMECTKRNGTIINVKDLQTEQDVKTTMTKNSLTKAWVGYFSDIKETPGQLGIREPYFIMNDIEDEQLEASSSFPFYSPEDVRIDSESAWRPLHEKFDQWIQVDLGKTMCVYGIVSQGERRSYLWITEYRLLYKNPGENFLTLQDAGTEDLSANNDNETPVYRNFTKPFKAQVIRLYPQEWHTAPAIKFDLLVSNDCPTDFTCGKCPAVVTTPTANSNFTIQYEPCCSKLPFICVNESCNQNQAQPNASAHRNTENSSPLSSGSQSTLITGLIFGMVLFMVASVILLILLIFIYRRLKQQECPSGEKAPYLYRNDKHQQKNTMDTPKLHFNSEMTPHNVANDVNTAYVNPVYETTDDVIETKMPQIKAGPTVCGEEKKEDVNEIRDYESIDTELHHTQAADTLYNADKKGNYEILNYESIDTTLYDDPVDQDGHKKENTVAEEKEKDNEATKTKMYDTPEYVEVYGEETGKDNSEIPEGVEMLSNDIYSD